MTTKNSAQFIDHNGRQYMVIPGVPVREGVMKNYFVSSHEIIRSLPGWNGTPLTLYHPKANNGSARVPDPDSPIIGYFYNAAWDKEKKRMVGEYWIDVQEAGKYEDGKQILDMVSNGQMVETSTGYWSDDVLRKGAFENRPYDMLHVNLLPDHIAVLPKQIGACSIKDGCGVNRNTVTQNCDCTKCHLAPDLAQNEMSLEDLETDIRQSFGKAFNKPNNTSAPMYGECYVEKTFPGYVIARKDGDLYRVPYTINGEEFLFAGESQWQKVDIQYVTKNQMPAFQTGHLPTSILYPFSFNKGSRTPEQLAGLRAHLQEKGIDKPVFLLWCDDTIKIMDGNHRVSMGYELGIEQVPVKVMNDDGESVDPEIVYRKYQLKEDQSYMGVNPSGAPYQTSKNQARQSQPAALKKNPLQRSRNTMDLVQLLQKLEARGIHVTANDDATEFALEETPPVVNGNSLSADEVAALKSLAQNAQSLTGGLGDIAVLAADARARASAEKAYLVASIKGNASNTLTDDELNAMPLGVLAKLNGAGTVDYSGLGGQSVSVNSDVAVLTLPAPMLTAKQEA